MTRTAADIEVRPSTSDDLDDILELLTNSLGWVPDDLYASFFRWKHTENPFGASPGWVAVLDGRIAGFRTWLPWEFEDDQQTFTAVRAVDTATHPDFQGQGIFRQLTMHGVEAMKAEGVEFVFNTPNEQSRPGYLKMGWHQVGKLPTAVRFASVGSAVRTVRARTPADKWSIPTDAGESAGELLADDDAVSGWLNLQRPRDGRLRTRLSAAFLRWRYGFEPLRYRGITTDDGLVLFRLRNRGPAVEGVVCLVLASDRTGERRLFGELARQSGADHLIQITSHPHVRAGFLPLPGQGPVLTWRELNHATMPSLDRWNLGMGDVELF